MYKPRHVVVLISLLILLNACRKPGGHALVSEIQLGNKAHADRLSGLREPTNGWRWAARSFDISLDPPRTSEAIYLELECGVPNELMDVDPSLTLIASVNGIEVGRQTWYRPGPARFVRQVPDAALRRSPAKVHFEVGRSVDGPDGKDAGLLAISVGLKPWSATAEYRSQRMWFAREGFNAAGAAKKERFPEARQLEFIRSFESLPVSANARFQGIAAARNPVDLWTIQQIMYEVQPEFVIETGTGEGGAALYLAHALHGMNLPAARVITVDRTNRTAEAAKQWLWPKYVEFIQSDPTAASVVQPLAERVKGRRSMVLIGGPPDPELVLEQINVYAPLVSRGSYLVVQNTYLDRDSTRDGAGPFQSVQRFLRSGLGQEFVPDESRELMVLTRNPGGWLRRK